jgi:hypothetical protein
MFAEQWWFDASAKSLGNGYRSYTVGLEPRGRISEMDESGLEPGDLAVTTNGRHILAYLGDGYWIQADPSLGKVATLHGKRDENPWFQTPITTHRWSVLNPH